MVVVEQDFTSGEVMVIHPRLKEVSHSSAPLVQQGVLLIPPRRPGSCTMTPVQKEYQVQRKVQQAVSEVGVVRGIQAEAAEDTAAGKALPPLNNVPAAVGGPMMQAIPWEATRPHSTLNGTLPPWARPLPPTAQDTTQAMALSTSCQPTPLHAPRALQTRGPPRGRGGALQMRGFMSRAAACCSAP